MFVVTESWESARREGRGRVKVSGSCKMLNGMAGLVTRPVQSGNTDNAVHSTSQPAAFVVNGLEDEPHAKRQEIPR
jgi:hypothetical protein